MYSLTIFETEFWTHADFRSRRIVKLSLRMRSPKGFNMPVRQPAEIATGETGGISAPTSSTTLKGLNNKYLYL